MFVRVQGRRVAAGTDFALRSAAPFADARTGAAEEAVRHDALEVEARWRRSASATVVWGAAAGGPAVWVGGSATGVNGGLGLVEGCAGEGGGDHALGHGVEGFDGLFFDAECAVV